MSDDFVIVPSREDDYTFLSRTTQGRLFKKHILTKGDLRHPKTGKTIKVDDEFIATMKANFEDRVCDIVQVPVAGDTNQHTEDPFRNIGEVVDIQQEGDRVYAVIDARDNDAANRLGKTLLGASAMMHTDYVDTRDGKSKGPTLLHVCVTNRPYVLGLSDYEEIIAASSDSSEEAVLLTEVEVEETEMPRTLKELLEELKTEHDIDVAALQAQVAKMDELEGEKTKLSNDLDSARAEAEQAVELSKSLTEALEKSGVVKLTNGSELSPEDVIGAVAELAKGHLELTNTVKVLQEKDARNEQSMAESAVQALVDEGKIMPSQKDGMVTLKLSNPDLFDKLVPEKAIISLNEEKGRVPDADDAQARHLKDIEEIARLTSEGGAAYDYIAARASK